MATSTRRKDFCSVSQSPLGRFAIFCAERHCVQEELRDCIERCRPLDLAPDFGTSVAGASNVTAKARLFGPATIGPPSYSLSSVSDRNRRLPSPNASVYFLLMFRSNGLHYRF